MRAMACKVPRQRWHSRQPWHCGICNLQNLNGPVGFESHPLRQLIKGRTIPARQPPTHSQQTMNADTTNADTTVAEGVARIIWTSTTNLCEPQAHVTRNTRFCHL